MSIGTFREWLREQEVNEAFDTNKNDIIYKRKYEKAFEYHMVKHLGGLGTNLLHMFFKSKDDMKNYYEENLKNWKGAQFYKQDTDDFSEAKKIKII